MKKYYTVDYLASGYKVNKKYHGLAVRYDNKKFFYLDYKNNTIFYYTNITTNKPTVKI